MTLVSLDVEADGPCPGLYSMVSFGAVIVDAELDKTFYGELKPISEKWVPEALAISGISRETHEAFDDPVEVMRRFAEWLAANVSGRPVIICDNPAFDWQWINYYFHVFYGSNPCGFSARRIGDIWCGYKKDLRSQWKQLRKTTHDHNPVHDAIGNAEVLLYMHDQGIKGIIRS